MQTTLLSEATRKEVTFIVLSAIKEMLDDIYCEDSTVEGHLADIASATAALSAFNVTGDAEELYYKLLHANVRSNTLSCVSDYVSIA